MLPWRVQLQRTFEALRDNPAFRNRLLAFVGVLVFLVGSFATGLEINIRFGNTSAGDLATGADGTEGGTFTADGLGETTEGASASGLGGSGSLSSGGARVASGGAVGGATTQIGRAHV